MSQVHGMSRGNLCLLFVHFIFCEILLPKISRLYIYSTTEIHRMAGLYVFSSLVAVFVCLIGKHSVNAVEIIHISCEKGELMASGPMAKIHADCSKDLTPEAEANLCEMACVMNREELTDGTGMPTMEKTAMYLEKSVAPDIREKSTKLVKMCFEKHQAQLKPYAEDKNCAASKEFNACMKNSLMNICNP